MSQTATVLVIDDEPQIRKFLRISLGSQGYKVLEAGTGADFDVADVEFMAGRMAKQLRVLRERVLRLGDADRPGVCIERIEGVELLLRAG